jgi:hypothetical protein
MNFSKYYTVDEVNFLLPQIRQQIEWLQDLKKQHQTKRDELQELRIALFNPHAPAAAEDQDPFFSLECELEFLEFQVKQLLMKFGEREILIKSIDAGLVDFPAMIDGEEVLLCWLKDEPQVSHYHSLNDGFWGRRKIDQG